MLEAIYVFRWPVLIALQIMDQPCIESRIMTGMTGVRMRVSVQ
jgi:hypothetical protein